jgi:hypothetical protein
LEVLPKLMLLAVLIKCSTTADFCGWLNWTISWRRPSRSGYILTILTQMKGSVLSHTWLPVIKMLQRCRGVPLGKKGQAKVGMWLHPLAHSKQAIYTRQ